MEGSLGAGLDQKHKYWSEGKYAGLQEQSGNYQACLVKLKHFIAAESGRYLMSRRILFHFVSLKDMGRGAIG